MSRADWHGVEGKEEEEEEAGEDGTLSNRLALEEWELFVPIEWEGMEGMAATC
jgi:hypothetical protein